MIVETERLMSERLNDEQIKLNATEAKLREHHRDQVRSRVIDWLDQQRRFDWSADWQVKALSDQHSAELNEALHRFQQVCVCAI